MSKNSDRKQWPEQTKAEYADKILNGALKFDDVAKELDIQPYQLWAWVGQHAVLHGRTQVNPDASGDTARMRALIEEKPATPADDQARKEILEFYIRNYVMKQSP